MYKKIDNCKHSSGRFGLFGCTLAYFAPEETQGRGGLHVHMHVWILGPLKSAILPGGGTFRIDDLMVTSSGVGLPSPSASPLRTITIIIAIYHHHYHHHHHHHNHLVLLCTTRRERERECASPWHVCRSSSSSSSSPSPPSSPSSSPSFALSHGHPSGRFSF